MKKFSRTLTAGLGIAAAMALSACHPPHENPSSTKTDNASTFTGTAPAGKAHASTAATTAVEGGESTEAAESSEEPALAAGATPQFINCVSAPATEPTEISLNCIDNSDVLKNISWTDWQADAAYGTASRVSGTTTVENVAVQLAAPTQTPQGLVFTQIIVDGATFTQ